MKIRKRKRIKSFFVGIFGFCLIAVLVFFGFQYFTKTGIFRIPGVVYYDESLSKDELDILHNVFTEEVDLDKDVTISGAWTFNRPALEDGVFLSEIYVPVTDFYSSETNVSEVDVENVLNRETDCDCDENFELIKIEDLDFNKKLLSIEDNYYLDNYDSGAVYRVITFESEKYDDEIAPLLSGLFNKSFPDKDSVLTFAQTGVTALSRGMNRKLYSVGSAEYFAENIKDYLSAFDITHTSNESSFTDFANGENICSDKRFIDTLLAIGLDVVELTGNHNQDCGNQAALDTIDTYNQNNIKIVGGGKTADEAAIPLQINQKGNDITMLAYNLSTGGATYGDAPGANQYNEENAAKEIATAKERGDVVIVDIQYYECSAYVATYEDTTCDYANSSAGDQIGFFRHLIDLGADVVVGTSAHQPQTFELYNDGAIYYGLGNLFFDQVWWPGTTRSLILAHYIYDGKILQTKVVPTVYDESMQTRLYDKEDAKWFLERLKSVRP